MLQKTTRPSTCEGGRRTPARLNCETMPQLSARRSKATAWAPRRLTRAAIRPAKQRDIVAKDLNASRILLSLYFTIFLNQLDNLFAYTEYGTIRPRSGLIGASFS